MYLYMHKSYLTKRINISKISRGVFGLHQFVPYLSALLHEVGQRTRYYRYCTAQPWYRPFTGRLSIMTWLCCVIIYHGCLASLCHGRPHSALIKHIDEPNSFWVKRQYAWASCNTICIKSSPAQYCSILIMVDNVMAVSFQTLGEHHADNGW